jgi:hypothetical protein
MPADTKDEAFWRAELKEAMKRVEQLLANDPHRRRGIRLARLRVGAAMNALRSFDKKSPHAPRGGVTLH